MSMKDRLRAFLFLNTFIYLFSLIYTQETNPSYIKIYKSETAVLRDLSRDFVQIGITNIVNNLTFSNISNYTSSDFPEFSLDLKKIEASGNAFSISNAIILNTNISTIATDPTNSSFVFFSAEYNLKNSTAEKKGNITAIFSSQEVTYIKKYEKSEKNIKIIGMISIMWKEGEFIYDSDLKQKLLISKAFNEHFDTNIKIFIEKELNSELKRYLDKQCYDKTVDFKLSQKLSEKKIQANFVNLKLLDIDAKILTSKTDTLLTMHYNGYLGSFSSMTKKPEVNPFNIDNIDLSKLYEGFFIDKSLFETILLEEYFKGFFIRDELKQPNIPAGLNLNLNIKDLSRIIPEVRYLYSLIQKINVNYAIFNPIFIFEENNAPKLYVNLDFTIYVQDAQKLNKQLFTCQNELIFNITIDNTKNNYLNFKIELVDIKKYEMSNNFSYINIDNLNTIIQEIINFSIESDKIKVFESDIYLGDVFEEYFNVIYSKNGLFLYYNLD